MQEARRTLEERARARAVSKLADYQERVGDREKRNGKGKKPGPPKDTPDDSEQANLTDPGHVNLDAFEELEKRGVDLYVAVSRQDGEALRRYDYRPPSATERPPKKVMDPKLVKMREKLKSEGAGRCTPSASRRSNRCSASANM